jgi:hypothetical protein
MLLLLSIEQQSQFASCLNFPSVRQKHLRRALSEKDAELAALELANNASVKVTPTDAAEGGGVDRRHLRDDDDDLKACSRIELLRHERFKLLSQIKSEDQRRIDNKVPSTTSRTCLGEDTNHNHCNQD